MSTIEKRFQVFVSSTYSDLIEPRQEVMQALLELDCMPAGMELFPAADDDQWTLIKKVIDDCDYYIVVIAGRYGSIGPGGKSYTQMEYEYAVETGKPVIAFLHKEPGSLPANVVEHGEAGKKRLEEFRALTQKKMCKFWATPADLGSVVSRSIVKLMKSNPGVGWIKADALPTQSATEELLRLRRQIEDLQGRLAEAQAASRKETEHLAQGDDTIAVEYTYSAYKPGAPFAATTFADVAEFSWNELFGRLSPLLIVEASDQTLKTKMGEMLFSDLVVEHRKEHAPVYNAIRGFSISDTSFDTIKVQFLALGLIIKSAAKKARSVNDRAAYWSLTPSGEALMMKLRAIPRAAKPLATNDAAGNLSQPGSPVNPGEAQKLGASE